LPNSIEGSEADLNIAIFKMAGRSTTKMEGRAALKIKLSIKLLNLQYYLKLWSMESDASSEVHFRLELTFENFVSFLALSEVKLEDLKKTSQHFIR
jgi:hypothetical protein